jgi:hypothetical protein
MMELPEHPIEKYPRQAKGQLIILVVTIICSLLAVTIIYLGFSGAITSQARSLGLLIVLFIWLFITSKISRAIYGRGGQGFGSTPEPFNIDEDD